MSWDTVESAPPEVLARMFARLADQGRQTVHDDLRTRLDAHG